MSILTFLILSLATYRLTHLIVFDKIFEPIRNLFVKRTVEFKTGTGPLVIFRLQGGAIRRFIGKLMNCFWCAGLWVSLVFIFFYYMFPEFTIWVYMILAVAAVQSLIETAWTKTVGYPEMTDGKKHAGP